MAQFFFIVVLLCFSNVFGSENPAPKENGSDRQKRLLFYDEEGNLVKTYTNPFLRDHYLHQDKIPSIGYLNPFLSFLRPPATAAFGNLPTKYMIPLADEVTQQVSNDPVYQNKLFFLPSRDQSIEPNPLCVGKRAQIPSPNSCSTFLNCWDGWAYEQECPTGLMFSSRGFCDYPHRVNCYDRRQNGLFPIAPVADEQPALAHCSKEFEAFRNQLECSEFFVCVNSVPIRFKCPADLAYNQELGICDYSNRVNCKGSLEVATEAPSASASSEQRLDATTLATAAPPSSPPKMFLTRNSVFNSHSFSSTYTAMSRQDAIRQLELSRFARVNSD